MSILDEARKSARRQHAESNGTAKPAGDYDARLRDWERSAERGEAEGPEPEPSKPANVRSFTRLTTSEFFAAEYPIDYLIEDVMVANQPLIIGGGKKNLKTNMLVDAGLSLASAALFLGKFRVTAPVDVGIMSGESGEAVLQETGKRIAKAKGLQPDQLDRLHWCFKVPRIGDRLHMNALRRFICEDELKVLAIDPAYMSIPIGDDAANLFAVGQFLFLLTELGQETGCTIVICHHTKKGKVDPFSPPELEDISWAGFQEWARQWLLISRRERFDPESAGEHRLWLNIGGSAGHSSLWALDITEGRRKDPGGRKWEVSIISAADAREQVAVEGDTEKQQRQSNSDKADDTRVLVALDNIDPERHGVSIRKVRDLARIGDPKMNRAVHRLTSNRVIEELRLDKQAGNGAVRKDVQCIRRVPKEHPHTLV